MIVTKSRTIKLHRGSMCYKQQHQNNKLRSAYNFYKNITRKRIAKAHYELSVLLMGFRLFVLIYSNG
jgi:hypothetical protein